MKAHQKYQTIGHHHFDWLCLIDGVQTYPRSALKLVQAGDGRWFMEQEFGTEYSRFEGVLKSSDDMDTTPVFFPDVESVARAAFELMKQVYPGSFEEKDLEEFLSD